jgi:hypothetical protein
MQNKQEFLKKDINYEEAFISKAGRRHMHFSCPGIEFVFCKRPQS